jgi:hypothetical protein
MSEIGRIRDHLFRPGSVAPADGLEIRVRSVRERRNDVGRRDLEIVYSVPGLPDGVARIRSDEPQIVAEELTAWATGHVRRFRPPRLATDAELSVELPSRDELWQHLVSALNARVGPDGLVFDEDGNVTLVLTPEEWQRYVFARERGARLDHGIDADRPGDRPWLAVDDISETAGSRGPGEDFVVLTDRGFHASTRAALPVVRSSIDW